MRSSTLAHDFYKGLREDLDAAANKASSFLASIGGFASGLPIIVQRGESYSASDSPRAFISKYAMLAGDTVLVDKLVDGTPIVLGTLATGPEAPILTGYNGADSLQSSVTTSNSSQAVFVTAITLTFTNCAAGTYEVIGHGGFIGQHTAVAGLVDIRIRADSSNTVNGNTKIVKTHNTAGTEMTVTHADKFSGLVVAAGGTITLTLEYRCNNAGTTTVRNTFLNARVIRTGP
jgi:hypothetical protein